MPLRLSQSRPALRLTLRRAVALRRVHVLTGLAIGLAVIATMIVSLPSGSAAVFLSLMLLGALGARREFRTPSLKELAFCSIAIIAALLIRPGARLAVSTYEATGFVTLVAFMAFVLALAIALGVLAEKLLAAGEDGA